jgi:hypothetical protein
MPIAFHALNDLLIRMIYVLLLVSVALAMFSQDVLSAVTIEFRGNGYSRPMYVTGLGSSSLTSRSRPKI